ncbi:MAG: TolC family protein [Gemmataceae bacterium]
MLGTLCPRPTRPGLLAWIRSGLCASVTVLPLACSTLDTASVPPPNPRGHSAVEAGPARQVETIRPVKHEAGTPALEQSQAKELPITLDAVLRLAELHNPRLGLAREKLHESQMTMAQGSIGWLPSVHAGIAYYRHEGGIQDFNGRLIHSSTGAVYPALQVASELDLREGVFQLIDLERRIWQQKAELSQVNNEVLLDAGLTYVDLLTARRGESIAVELERHERKLLDRAEKLAKSERGAAGLVESIKATLSNRNQLASRLRQQGNAASAKLVYLLGLPPGTCLLPMDLVLAPIELVDVTPSTCDLIAQAFSHGPGLRELEGILETANRALDKTSGTHNMLPTVQLNAGEGPFGAGPGGSLGWDNRLDLGLQVRWNITALCQTEFKRNLIRSRQAQVMYNYEDLKGKLALGVTEARDSILAGREQIGLATSQIRHASESYRLSDRRLEEGLQGASSTDVLLAIRNLEQAHYNHLQAIQNHNKAQIKLLMFLGGGPGNVPAGPAPVAGSVALPEPRPGVTPEMGAPQDKPRPAEKKAEQQEPNMLPLPRE